MSRSIRSEVHRWARAYSLTDFVIISGTTMLEFQPQHSDLGVPISEYQFWNSDFGMSIPAFQFWNSDLNFDFGLQILASQFRSSNSGILTFETRPRNPDLKSPTSELHVGIPISEI